MASTISRAKPASPVTKCLTDKGLDILERGRLDESGGRFLHGSRWRGKRLRRWDESRFRALAVSCTAYPRKAELLVITSSRSFGFPARSRK
jgi:hypothetical protein